MFDWDRSNLRKIRAHLYEQSMEGEIRFVYYSETDLGRLLAVVVTERAGKIRVVTAYELDAGQKRDYLDRRMNGEKWNA